jgi:hypothetical protein
VEALAIESPEITAKGLSPLSRLESLTHLTLDQTVIQVPDHTALLQLPKLSFLHVLGNNLTAQDADRLRALWPDAKVEFGGKSAFTSTNPVWETSLRIERE